MPLYLRDLNNALLKFLPLILLVASTNFFIDPANIFKNRKFEKEIIDTLKSGKNVGFTVTMSQLDEVAFVEDLSAYVFSPIDILVLGSSRAFSIGSEIFPAKRFLNASISSLKLGDLLGLYEIFENKSIVVKNLILSLDPDLFVLDFMPRSSLYLGFIEMSKKIGVDFNYLGISNLYLNLIKIKILKCIEIFSPAYFQDSFKLILAKQFGYNGLKFNDSTINLRKQDWYPTYDSSAIGGLIFPDGSREFCSLLTSDAYDTAEYIKKCSFDMERIKKKKFYIKPESRFIFEKFIKYLETKNINVIFYLPPHHRFTYSYETGLNPNSAVLRSELYLRSFALDNAIQVVGSFDPYFIGINNDEMIDHHHPKRATAAKLFANFYTSLLAK